MQKLQGIAVSPGVAIGEALVMDTEGFRIPRRFVARRGRRRVGTVGQGDRGGSGRNFPPSRERFRRVGREIRGDLRGPSANAAGLAAAERAGGDDPPAALLARIRGQPHLAATPRFSSGWRRRTWPSGPTTFSTSRSGCCGTCWAVAGRAFRISPHRCSRWRII